MPATYCQPPRPHKPPAFLQSNTTHVQYSALTAAKCPMSLRYRCTKQTSFIVETPAPCNAADAADRQQFTCSAAAAAAAAAAPIAVVSPDGR